MRRVRPHDPHDHAGSGRGHDPSSTDPRPPAHAGPRTTRSSCGSTSTGSGLRSGAGCGCALDHHPHRTPRDHPDPVRVGRRPPARLHRRRHALRRPVPRARRSAPTPTSSALAAALPRPGARLSYRYDLGDCWDHTVLLETGRPGHQRRTVPPASAAGVTPPSRTGPTRNRPTPPARPRSSRPPTGPAGEQLMTRTARACSTCPSPHRPHPSVHPGTAAGAASTGPAPSSPICTSSTGAHCATPHTGVCPRASPSTSDPTDDLDEDVLDPHEEITDQRRRRGPLVGRTHDRYLAPAGRRTPARCRRPRRDRREPADGSAPAGR